MGMKKANREFKMSDVCQIRNDVQVMSNMCMAPVTVVKESRKWKKELYRDDSRVGAKEIATLLMMLLGVAAIIFSFVEAYFMEYYEFYSQYVFLNLDQVFIVMIAGFSSLMCGIRLALTS